EDGEIVALAGREERERLRGRRDRRELESPPERLKGEDAAVRVVVVDDERTLAPDVRRLVDGLGSDRRRVDREVERRAGARLALHPDPAAHQLDEALADREAEAGPPVLARGRGVDLAG